MSAWLARHRAPVLFLASIVVVAGVVDATRMPVSLFPTIDFPRIVVNVEAGDRPIDRMASDVTLPLEQAVRSVADVRGVRSTTSRGAAELSLRFAWGTDMGRALLETESALARARGGLPADIEVATRRMDPTVFPVLGFSLTSKTKDAVALRNLAVHDLTPLLSAVEGVAHVNVLGGAAAEIEVRLDPLRLRDRGVTVDDVRRAVAAGNVVRAVGRIEDRGRLSLVVVEGGVAAVDALRQRPVKASSAGVVVLGDVADVELGTAPRWTRVTADDHEAVLLEVVQQRSGNTLAIERQVNALLQRHDVGDVVVRPYYDQGELVLTSATSVRDAIVLGALIAAVVLLLFLRDGRITVVVALALPIVLATVVLVLDALHQTFNVMTLGGMAAAAGLVIDDAVVVVEHIVRRRGAGASTLAAGRETLRPLLGSSLATVVVFVPLASLGGVAGGFFRALAITVAASLVVSFAVAFVVVPIVADLLAPRAAPRLDPRWWRSLQDRYARLLRAFLQRASVVVVVTVVTGVVIGAVSFAHVGQGFLPAIDEGGFILDYAAPPGASVTETDRLLRQVEGLIKQLPEVQTWSRRTGLQLGGGLTESNTGDFFVRLRPGRRRDIEDVMAELRTRVEREVPDLRVETMQLMEDVIGDLTAVPQPIEVKLFADDQALLARTAKRVAAAIGVVAGVVEVFDGITIAGDDVVIDVDAVSAAAEGLAAEDVAVQAGRFIDGETVGELRDFERRVPVVLRAPAAVRQRIDDLGALALTGGGGQLVPLARLATVSIRTGQAELEREDLQHMIAVTARVTARDLGSVMVDVKAAVAAADVTGVRVAWGGLYAEQQRSFVELGAVFVSAVVLVIVLLLFLLRRASAVTAIVSTTLLSMCGVLCGLWVTGTELNIASLMGLTMVVGVVTEIGVFYFAELGEDLPGDVEALVAAGVLRLRPILMTSSIAGCSLMPLAAGVGGAGLLAPLAVAIIAGLVVAVPLVLLVMPALFRLLRRDGSTGDQSSRVTPK